jgi:methyl-accepting chemotaxis protein
MGFLHDMTLKAKLTLLTGVMLAALVITGAMGYKALTGLSGDVHELAGNNVPSLVGIYTLRIGVNQAVIQLNRVRGLDNDPKFQEKLADSLDLTKKAIATMEKGWKLYEPLPQTKEEEEIWKVFVKDFEKWKSMRQKFDDEIVTPASRAKDIKEAQQYFDKMSHGIEEMRPARAKVLEDLGKIGDLIDKYAKENGEKAEVTAGTSVKMMLTVIAVSLLIAIPLAIVIISSTNKSIVSAVETINEGALQISDASDQVSSSSTSLAQGASEQASSVEEVSATLEEASAAVASNTENARQADILAKQANISAREGLIKGEELVVSMREVNDSASKIANIVKAIDQIAFQVNLLALNAAVEAARAGEHGLGFAVVADEVRNLAQRAANSAKETAVVIQDTVEQIKKGSNIAQLASDSFRDIEDKSKKVSDLIGEVALSSREQAEAVAQLNMAMAQIDQVTQQVAANSEEAAAASEELNAQAGTALEAIAGLAKIVGLDMGKRAVKAPPTRVSRPAGMVTGNRPKIAMKSHTSQPTARKSNDDVFPLSENDLKEF